MESYAPVPPLHNVFPNKSFVGGGGAEEICEQCTEVMQYAWSNSHSVLEEVLSNATDGFRS
jgi:hypothetical protein